MSGLLVSIHDVTPVHAEAVRRLFGICRAHDVLPALLVVPNWHGAWPIDGDPSFLHWLRQAQHCGAEILLHGERHDEHGCSRSWTDELRAFARTAREGEFLGLDYAEALARMSRGVNALRRLGLSPAGFVPPAWLSRPATHAAARHLGFEVSEDFRHVYVLQRNERLRSPVVCWSARTTLRAGASVLRARWQSARPAPRQLTRLTLHPMDLQHPWTTHSLQRTLARWSARVPVTTYAQVVDRRPTGAVGLASAP